MIGAPRSPRPMDWEEYDLQEDEEPFDAVRRMADPPPAGAELDRLILETKVQALARVAKEHANSLGSGHDEFLRAVKCDVPAYAASYCKRRYGGSASALLKWHYCIALHVAEREGEWLGRAVKLMLESADSAGDERRASSYLVIAHNLNRWHNCGMDDAVAGSALRLARGRKDSRLAHIYARVVACAEKIPRRGTSCGMR